MINGIQKIEEDIQLKECVDVLRDAFSTVVMKFGLTVKNCPSNTAFIDFAKLKSTQKQGVEYFGFYEDGHIIACIGLKEKSQNVYEITKLGVRTSKRNKSIGKKLIEYSFFYLKTKKGNKITLGMIDEDKVLKQWYKKHGFVIVKCKKFKHLPFKVCFMEKTLNL